LPRSLRLEEPSGGILVEDVRDGMASVGMWYVARGRWLADTN
jgi:hypothetical protein